jgi:eukaryotic-like serine/threonine-protein kinase
VTSSDGLIRAGSLLKQRYRLQSLLGRGGMASVWLAYDQVLERDVAVKVLSDTIASDPGFLARFRREARLVAGLSHPNLIGIWDYAGGEERPYLVMEYVPGENVAQRLSEGKPIDCERLARELLGALAHIHGAGILHRDIKPQNVLIGPDGDAKLIDFGIALPADATSLTHTGQVLGTARFIAPEIMRGEPATERSDLYSCGVVLRECVGGAGGPLRSLVARLTSEDPRDRPASAGAALSALGGLGAAEVKTEPLDATVEFEPTQSYPTAEPRRPTPTFDRDKRSGSGPALSRVLAAAAVLAGVVAVAAVLIAGSSTEDRGGSANPAAAADSTPKADGSAPADSGDAGDDEEAGAEEDAVAEEGEEGADEEQAEAQAPQPEGEDPVRGSALNQEGFELIQAGRPEEAVPVLEEAVAAFPSGSEDLEYGYALFNLGNALRLSGRPEEAIPVLEQRLQIPDQLDVVRSELAAAERDAAQ